MTCRVLKIARQPYYRWLANPVTDAELTAAYRPIALFDAHRDEPEFGDRFLLDEAREAGEPMSERTAWKICSDLGWWSSFGKKRGKNGKKPAAEQPWTQKLWVYDFERHEALLNRAVVRGHRLRLVAAGWVKLRAA